MSPQVASLKELTARTQGFKGGVNLRDAADQLGPDELRKCENAVMDFKGGLAKRLGTQSRGTFGSSPDLGLSTYTFYRPGNNPQVLLHTTAGILYYTNDVTANPIVWTQITSGLSTTVPCAFETANSMVFFCEGTKYSSWDGTTFTNYPAAPTGKFLRLWKDTMWVAGASADRVYASSAGDPTTFPALNWVDILHGDGDSVTGLMSDGLFLIVGKLRRMQVIYDPALLYNRTADFEKGMESHFAVIHNEDKLYYLTRVGICWWQGDSSSRLISYKIDPLFQPSVLNYSAMSKAYSYSLGDRCGWVLPEVGSSVPSLVIEYYPRFGPVYQISGNIGPGPWVMHRMPMSCFTTVRVGTVENIYGANTGANKYMQAFAAIGTDDGVTFPTTIETGAYDFGDPINTKYLRRVKIVGRGKFFLQLKRNFQNAVYVTKTVDMTGSSTTWNTGTWNTGTWGPDANIKEAILNFDAYGRVFSICITDSETTTGTQVFPVGSKDYSLTEGEWAFYQASLNGDLLGLRG